ncbi:MAG: hypothetical protein J6U54_19590 [Clostridiales bacterium]|nr:hypothetical protein [Clostridiales bacterium]
MSERIKGTYKIADKIISVDSIYRNVHNYCQGYEASGDPEIVVKTSAEDILFEKERAEEEHSDGYLEELAVYRHICEKMPFYNTFMFHGSCIAVDGIGYLFGAPSGTGKSTHAKIWCDNLGDRAVMVNDDKPLLKVENGTIYAYGTPYNGKHRRGTNMRAPLKAICFLHQAPDNSIRPLEKAEAYTNIITQTYRPFDMEAFVKTMELVDVMLESLKFYSLGCNMEREAFEVSFGAMNK